LLELQKLQSRGVELPEEGDPLPREIVDLLAGFRAAAVGQVLDRVATLHRRDPIPLLAVSGGVAANRLLRREVLAWGERAGVPVRLVPMRYAGDNAAMIAWRALLEHRAGRFGDLYRCEAESRIPLASGLA